MEYFALDIAPILGYDSVGLIGVILYISSYAALQLGLLQGSGYTYTLMNLAAAILVLVSLMESFNLSSAIIQITWITISIFGLSRLWARCWLSCGWTANFELLQ